MGFNEGHVEACSSHLLDTGVVEREGGNPGGLAFSTGDFQRLFNPAPNYCLAVTVGILRDYCPRVAAQVLL